MLILKQKKLLLTIVLSAAIFLSSAPFLVHAAGLVPCGGPSDAGPCTVTDIFVLVARVTNWLISVAGLYAVYLIINHGFWLTVSMGNEEAITTRKAALSNAVVGFVLVLLAFMFVNTTVNIILGQGLLADTGQTANPACKLDLTNPLTYLQINSSCSNIAH